MSLSHLLNKNHNLFISAVKQAANKLDNGARIEIPHWQITDQEDGSFRCDMSQLATFRQIPEKGNKSNRSNKINVFVKGHMQASKVGKTILFKKYKTSVLYCRPAKPSDLKTLKNPLGYHYDYDKQVSPAHPIFHAQQDNSLLIQDVSSELDIQFYQNADVGEGTNGNESDFRTIRIPTCQLDFYSTILMVIADHLVDHSEGSDVDIFHKLIDNCTSYWLAPEQGDEDGEYSKHLFSCSENQFNSSNWYCFRK